MIGSNFDPQLVATAKQTIQECLSLDIQSDPSTIQSKTTKLAHVIIKLLGTGISTHTYSLTQEISPEASMFFTRILTDIGNVQQSAAQPTHSQPRAINLSPLDKLQTKIQRLQQLIDKSFKIQALNEFGDINENNIDAYLITIGDIRGSGDIEVPLVVAASITDHFDIHEPALNLAKQVYNTAKERCKLSQNLEDLSLKADAIFKVMASQQDTTGISWRVQHYCQATVLYDNGFNSMQDALAASAMPVMKTPQPELARTPSFAGGDLELGVATTKLNSSMLDVLKLTSHSDVRTIQTTIETLSQSIMTFFGLGFNSTEIQLALGISLMHMLSIANTLLYSFTDPQDDFAADLALDDYRSHIVRNLIDSFERTDTSDADTKKLQWDVQALPQTAKPQFDVATLLNLQTQMNKFIYLKPSSKFQSFSDFQDINQDNIFDYLILIATTAEDNKDETDLHLSIALTVKNVMQTNQSALEIVQGAYEVAKQQFNFAVRRPLLSLSTGGSNALTAITELNKMTKIAEIMQNTVSQVTNTFKAIDTNLAVFEELRKVQCYCRAMKLYNDGLKAIQALSPSENTAAQQKLTNPKTNIVTSSTSTAITPQPATTTGSSSAASTEDDWIPMGQAGNGPFQPRILKPRKQ